MFPAIAATAVNFCVGLGTSTLVYATINRIVPIAALPLFKRICVHATLYLTGCLVARRLSREAAQIVTDMKSNDKDPLHSALES